MQKKTNRFLVSFLFAIVCFFCLFPNLCHAQNSKHSLMLWSSAGYSTFFTKWDSFKNTGNFGSGVGFGYNMLIREHFIFSAGIEYLSLNSSTRPFNLIIFKDLIDTEEDEYIMKYTLRKFVQLDKTHNLFVPIYIGFKTNLNKVDFYFLAGGKIGYMFASSLLTKISSYTTIGIYDRFIDPFEDMPNHYFDTKKYYKNNTLDFNKLQAVVSLELGIELPSVVPNNALRISLFADYGLLNRQTSKMQQSQEELFTFKTIPNDITVNNLYYTNLKSSTNTATFFAGVKITFLFDVTKPPCPTCLGKGKSVSKSKR